jgi:hypothetical protein
MQDNYQYDFDEKFVNQAWSQMRQMLDDEMPVDKEPQRKAWIWWLMGGLLLLSVTLTGLYFYQSNQEEFASGQPAPAIAGQQPMTPAGSPRIREAEVTAASSESEEWQSETERSVEIAAERAAAEITPELPSSADPASNLAASSISHQSLPLSDTPEERAGIIGDFGSSTLPLDPMQTQSPVLTDNQPITQDYPAQANEMMRVDLLESPVPTVVDGVPYSLEENSSIEPISRKKPFIKLGVEGSGLSLGTDKVHGFGAALLANVQKADSRLYLKTALGYQVLKPDLIERENTLQFSNTALMAMPAEPGQEIPPSFLTETSSVTELRYIYLSVSAGYQLNEKLSLEVGLQPSWLQGSTLMETWTHTAGDTGTESAPFVTRLSDNEDAVTNSNLSLITGLAYQINPSFGLNLEYQNGLRDILASNHKAAYLRGVKIGVAYYIR